MQQKMSRVELSFYEESEATRLTIDTGHVPSRLSSPVVHRKLEVSIQVFLNRVFIKMDQNMKSLFICVSEGSRKLFAILQKFF